MKALRALFILLSLIAVIGIATGHPWHIGSLALCLTMIAVTTEDEEETAGRR